MAWSKISMAIDMVQTTFSKRQVVPSRWCDLIFLSGSYTEAGLKWEEGSGCSYKDSGSQGDTFEGWYYFGYMNGFCWTYIPYNHISFWWRQIIYVVFTIVLGGRRSEGDLGPTIFKFSTENSLLAPTDDSVNTGTWSH